MRTRPAAVAVRADDRERGPDPGLAGAPRGELSRAEQRVAILASSGRSNREIAEELHVTVSTVEQHLTRIYRKLGIPGRNRLRGMALATPAARS
jgi:DNA-binding CsgD family transcriptional regulator